jgi:hypothetical protein
MACQAKSVTGRSICCNIQLAGVSELNHEVTKIMNWYTAAIWANAAFLTVTTNMAGASEPYGGAYVEPVPVDSSICSSRAMRPMPDLARLRLRTDSVLHAAGEVIKGMYYAHVADGPNDLVAFRLGCGGVLDARPFLVFDFASGLFLLDGDGDGCADGAGQLLDEIDPAEFLPALSRSRSGCAPTS